MEKLTKSMITSFALLALASPAMAEEEEESKLQLSGFVDASFSMESVNSSKPSEFGFSLDQVELDIERDWKKSASALIWRLVRISMERVLMHRLGWNKGI